MAASFDLFDGFKFASLFSVKKCIGYVFPLFHSKFILLLAMP